MIGDIGGVTGVYSLPAARPLKVGNFDARAAGQGATAPGAVQ
ncbi:hypothetical protein [Massilia cavernae]|nr:hypothetical protein [Massilia cavernae]